MAKERRPVDVEALLYYLLEKVDNHIGGGDRSWRSTMTVSIPAIATSAAAATGAGGSDTPTAPVALPAVSTTTQVIP